jgi:hypothetical protein
MVRNLKNFENETQTLDDLEHGKKSEIHGKGEPHTVGSGKW